MFKGVNKYKKIELLLLDITINKPNTKENVAR